MSEAQLRNRIRKITKRGKMRSFVAVRPLRAFGMAAAQGLWRFAVHAGRILAASGRGHVLTYNAI